MSQNGRQKSLTFSAKKVNKNLFPEILLKYYLFCLYKQQTTSGQVHYLFIQSDDLVISLISDGRYILHFT